MITTDDQWQFFFERAGCTDHISMCAESAIHAIEANNKYDDIISASAVKDLEKNLCNKLFALYRRVLCELVKEKIGELKFSIEVSFSDPDEPSAVLLDAADRVKNELTNDPDLLFTRFPLLKEKEKIVTENFINAQLELLERFASKREEISETIFDGKNCSRICGVLNMNALTRLHGRSVTGLVTDRGILYYKPYDCTVYTFFEELTDRFFSDITTSARVVTGPGYGFCSQIVRSPATSSEEIPRYYYRFGALTALINSLCGTDIHRENVIACGGFPTVIDLENLITPTEKTGSVRAKTVADDYVSGSVLNLCNLPTRNYLVPFLSSALHKCEAGSLCLPELNGDIYDVTGYEEEFIRGFADGYDRVADQSAEILAVLDKYSEMELRYLYNSPKMHNYMMNRLLVPRNLESSEHQNAELDRNEFTLKQRGKDFSQNILDYEKQFIIENDVPYYFVKLNECSLYGTEGVLIDDLFLSSPADMVKTRLCQLSEQDKKTEIMLIRHCFDHALFDETSKIPETKIISDSCERSRMLSEVRRIFTVLQSEKMCTPDGTIFFRSGIQDYLMQGRFGIASLQADVVVFCSTLLMNPGLCDIHQDAEKLLDECLDAIYDKLLVWEKVGVPIEVPVGMRFGYGGLVFAMLCGAEAGNKRCSEMLNRFVLLLSNKPAAVPALSGLVNGRSGLLFALCKADTDDKDAERIRIAQIIRLADEISDDIPQKKDPFLGYGALGVALISAGNAVPESDYIARGTECFKKIIESYSENEFLPGIGLFSVMALDILGDDPTVKKCLEKSVEFEMRKDILLRQDIIENGNALRVLFLLGADRYCPVSGCRKRAESIISAMISRRDVIGEFISSPDGMKNSFDTSYFTGTLGVGSMLAYYSK